MNLYVLVEGKTERKVYPKWFSYLLPKLIRVTTPDKAVENNYYLISGGGFPSLLDNHLKASVEDVNTFGNYDFLILCIDSDGLSPEKKLIMINEFIAKNNIATMCDMKVIVQHKCMETWFMGNRKVYSRSPSQGFVFFSQSYDVSQDDPELMGKPDDFSESYAIYHYQYLKSMLSEKNIRYSKSNPGDVMKEYYLNELRKRTLDTPGHLNTLQTFFGFCLGLSAKL